MGGRNQNTQQLRSGWAVGAAVTEPAVVAAAAAADAGFESERDELELGLPIGPPEYLSAPGVLAETLVPREASKGFPGDLGVLAEPKEANAPEPRPKALDAPPVGEPRAPEEAVDELKGLDLPCEELSPPNRLANALRPEELSPWAEDPAVDRESLVELVERSRQVSHVGGRRGRGGEEKNEGWLEKWL